MDLGFRGEVADYVLSDFDAVERAQLADVLPKALQAVRTVVVEGVDRAMTETNAKTPARNAPRAENEVRNATPKNGTRTR